MSHKFEDAILVVAEKVDDNKYLASIKNAFTTFLPFVIVGSLGSLLNNLIASPTSGLAQWIPSLTALGPAFTLLNYCTMSFMTVPIIFLVATNLARRDKVPEHITGIVCIAAYISMVPNVIPGPDGTTVSGLVTGILGAQGLFIGMISAVVYSQLFGKLTKIDRIKIKMPDSVPPAIATSFNVLLPILITLLCSSIFGIAFKSLTGTYVNDFIYTFLQTPLEIMFQSPVGIVLVVLISQIFWVLGIHGGLVISPIRNPLMAAAIAANIAAASSGAVPDQPVTYGFWMNFVVPGGAGCILSLIIAIMLFSKRDDYREVAKFGLPSTICGIPEPVYFGLPVVLNPTFAIPLAITSPISTAIAMFATNIGFLPCNTVDVPLGLPVLISPFIRHGWQGVVVQIICIAVTTAIWVPFVLISNRQAKLEQEKKKEQDAAALEEAEVDATCGVN